jgi:putative flippase GtrA
MRKESWFISFFRYQVAAITATLVDFLVLILLTEVFNVWYVYSTALGALTGAIVNFNLCRYWAFCNSKNKFKHQVFRYILVSSGSLILNTLFVFILTHFASINYSISKIITALLVAFFYNYTLQRFFVFKK